MTTTPVLFYRINVAPPFNGPLTISETTLGDVNTASFFDASNDPVNQGIQLGVEVKWGYVGIGETYYPPPSTAYFFLDGKFLGESSDQTVGQVITDLQNAYTKDIVNGGNNWTQLAIDDAAIEAANGNDVLIGQPNDTLTGGGGSNTFVFNLSFGKETVKDFNVGQDVLRFDHTLFANATASQVLSQTHDSKAGAVIVVDAHDTVTLTGVTVAQLQSHSSDFFFF
jgi:hypothetical protein